MRLLRNKCRGLEEEDGRKHLRDREVLGTAGALESRKWTRRAVKRASSRNKH